MHLKLSLYSLTIWLFHLLILEGESSKILGVFPTVGGSHYIMSHSLMKGLAEAGNNVTIISPHADNTLVKNGSYTRIVLKGFAENYQNDMKHLNLFEVKDFNNHNQEAIFQKYMYQKTEMIFRDEGVWKLIESNETFDAVIVEQFSNDALKVLANVFGGHLIVFDPIGPFNFVNRLIGNPTMVSYNPQVVSTFPRPMSFKDRLHNLLLYSYEEVMNHFVFLPTQDRLVKKYFPGAPSIRDITTNVSLVLLNSHESTWQTVPLVPNAVPIGGFHIAPPKELPKEIKVFLDGATNGAILFSLGTNLKISDMDERRKSMFLNVFAKLDQRILWKADENISSLPPHVKIVRWLPQMDVLAHDSIKLFITHGGLLSLTESVYNGVPILAIPVYGDQATNANNAVKAGFGLSINYHDPDFNEDKLMLSITELLRNNQYKTNALKLSKVYHDRPVNPLDLAVYWVNFVIQHNGAPHLRVDGLYLHWYQYLLIDVIAYIFIQLIVVAMLLTLFLKFVLKATIRRNKKMKQQ
ncbi:unnamed protein product [Phyllotreta striolata]|uniref:UDP-glucuronosyltransferase n=1 Tax=Phyllotreta striolata TaxID=444603 RepID=A0A9N9TVY4_PHYSR|nr:unnamed protein product [Phyllotreta striolata]